MIYKTYDPSEKLQALVKCYWTLEGPKEEISTKQTIIPDGCMEMIFHYGDFYRQYSENGTFIVQPKCFVIGQLTRPLVIEPVGQTGIFSVRFHPGGFFPLTTIPIKEMENTAVALRKIFGKEGETIGPEVLAASSADERILLIEKFLFARLTDATTIDRIIKSTVETIFAANGQLSVNELSNPCPISRRHLERKFSSAVGLSPKKLSKIIRLQATLKILINKEYANLTTLAYKGKYFDQAHFIKDFKELTGLTPKEFYGSNLRMTSLFCSTE